MKHSLLPKVLLASCMLAGSSAGFAAEPAFETMVTKTPEPGAFRIAEPGAASTIVYDEKDWPGVIRAAKDLSADVERVTGLKPNLTSGRTEPGPTIVVGTVGKSALIDALAEKKAINVDAIRGKWESYQIEVLDQGQTLVIAGSDKRGTIYGIYELSGRMGVSPWYWWADVPVKKSDAVYVRAGRYVQGPPKVKYRGIFLNDEAPCLTSWVKNQFGTSYGGHKFYEKVFELILRLRGNYMWPAMWSWAFYADDPLNSPLADEMGVVMGTSHHEPMARNHQEWARKRRTYGAWDYATNKKVLDEFFAEGVRRIADKEDVITIGMRGDGDAPMGGQVGHDDEYVSQDEANLALLRKVIQNQREIIRDVTGQPPEKHPQLWALYKEVQKFYELGLRVPDDVIILVSDDNWGDVRRLPNAEERKRSGGWGLYYHVDYVGAPRNSKWQNITPIQNLWEQLTLTYEYGVDKLWVLNVGDLKPMEYPITLFMDIAWDPQKYTASNLLEHPRKFCAEQFGEKYADEAARLLNLYSKYNGRVTAEMLDASTYNLHTGEWKQVRDDYLVLEAEALRQYLTLDPACRDAYKQLILFPIQAMANIYDMYYSQAMNRDLYGKNDPRCNEWADRVQKAFSRDKELAYDYNRVMSGGKWNGMMTQKHIGYTSWDDNFREDKLPQTFRIDASAGKKTGGYQFEARDGVVSMEAEHFHSSTNAANAAWTIIPDMGRTLSGVTLMPRLPDTNGASLTYRMTIPDKVDSVKVHVVVKSTLAFDRYAGHRYTVSLNGGEAKTVNFNEKLNEDPANIYSVFYPTVARRVVENTVSLPLPKNSPDGVYELTISPLDKGIVFEKIVVDCGGYKPSYLFMPESPVKRSK